MLDYTRSVGSLIAGDPEVADLIGRARGEPDALNPIEWSRFVEFAYMRFGAWEAAFIGLQQETVEDHLWAAWDHAMRELTTGPGYRRFWTDAGPGYAREFKRYVDAEIYPPAQDQNRPSGA